MTNKYGTPFGGPFRYGPQPGMTSGDTIGRYCSHDDRDEPAPLPPRKRRPFQLPKQKKG